MVKYIDHFIIYNLKEALECSKLESANFTKIGYRDGYPTNEIEADRFIKERVELHYETWIASPLKIAIDYLEEFNKLAREKK